MPLSGPQRITDLDEVQSLDDQDQFIIYQNSTARSKRVKRGNLFGSQGIVVKGQFIDQQGNDVGLSAALATGNAALAIANAQAAQTSADGKNAIFYSNDAPSTSGRKNGDVWFETDNGYKTYKWGGGTSATAGWDNYESDGDQVLSRLNVGKLTGGWVSSQVFELANTNAFIQSSSYIQTWAAGLLCRPFLATAGSSGYGKVLPSDNVRVKVLQSDGSFNVYKSKLFHTSGAGNAPGNTTYWEQIIGTNGTGADDIPLVDVEIEPGVKAKIKDFGFRIVGQGQAEFGGAIIRGAITAEQGFFGTTKNAIRLDSGGLTIGNLGRIKSAGIGYDGTNFFATAGEGSTSGGFFLGNTQAESQQPLYQFFIGKPTGNNLRWDGKDLRVNARVFGIGDGVADKDYYGITIGSSYGIRTTANNRVLTISAGNANGIQNGAQIDLVGSRWNTGSGDDGNGALILQAGYNTTSGFDNGTINARDGSIELRTSYSTTVISTSGTDVIHSDVGITRMTITKRGLVYVGTNPNEDGDKQDGGNFRVLNNIQVGGFTPYNLINGAHGSISVKDDTSDTRISLGGQYGEILIYNASEELKIKLSSTSGEIQASSYKSTSSKRFKKKIKNLKNGLNLVNCLRPVTFEWKNENGFNDIGLIAEEVNEVLPMVIAKNEKGEISGLDYGRLTPILIQAVKELSAEINTLKIKINHARSDKL